MYIGVFFNSEKFLSKENNSEYFLLAIKSFSPLTFVLFWINWNISYKESKQSLIE